MLLCPHSQERFAYTGSQNTLKRARCHILMLGGRLHASLRDTWRALPFKCFVCTTGLGEPADLNHALHKNSRLYNTFIRIDIVCSKAHEDVACGTHMARLKPLKPHRAVLQELTAHISSCGIFNCARLRSLKPHRALLQELRAHKGRDSRGLRLWLFPSDFLSLPVFIII